ncbi:MAG: PqqD family protein [Candidatus Omnitrophota bacterium]
MLIRKNIDVVEALMPDEAVVVDVRNKMFYTLNSSARVLWGLLGKRPKHLRSLTEQYRKELGIDSLAAARDVRKCLSALSKRKLILTKPCHD